MRRIANRLLFLVAGVVMPATVGARTGSESSAVSYELLVANARKAIMANPQSGPEKVAIVRNLALVAKSAHMQDELIAASLFLEGEWLLRVGQLSQASSVIDQARIKASRSAPQSKLMGDILVLRGSISAANVAVANALTDYQTGFRIYQHLRRTRSQAIALVYIAALYSDGKNHEAALRYLDQAAEAHPNDSKLDLTIHNNRGTDLAAMGRNAEAAREFGAALVLAREMNSPALEAQILRNIVRAHLADGRLDAAERIARSATAAARKAGGQEEPAMLSVAAQLAFQRGRQNEALSLIERSFEGVDLRTSTMPMREAHLTAYRIHEAAENAPEALAHLRALKRLDDEATKLATQTSTALMGAQFDFANQELRIARLKAEELRRTVKYEQDKAQDERLLFAAAAATALIVVLLLTVGLLAIRRSRNAVSAANDDLAVTNSALSQALAAKTEFLATTSHEIRTPLNGILGMTEVMLLDRTLSDEARDRVRLVHGAGKTMRALVDDILDVAKIEKGKLSLDQAPFDLAHVVRDAAGLWENQIRAKGVRFDLAVELPARQVVGDGARVRQIIFNLLSNATKFTESGVIKVTASLEGDHHRVVVSDTGVGIAPDKLEQVFESFSQADASTTRRFGGTGLGLSISRSLARAMGGDLAVTSSPGAGSTFTLTVPLLDHVEERQERPADGAAVLIVDRNPIMRAMLRNLVSPHADRVLCAASAEEALVAIEAEAPCALMLDENVLGDSAVGSMIAAARLRGAAATILRSPGSADYPISALGAAHVIEKPVTGPSLIAAMFATRVNEEDTDPLVSRAA